MHALAPLLLVLIMFRYQNLQTDMLYRANAFFLVGFYYFFFLQYNIYWFRIFPSGSLLQYVPSVLVTLLIVGIALSSWNLNSHPLKTALLGTLFVASLIASYGFDAQIKEKLAELGGYYGGESFYPATTRSVEGTKAVDLASIGVALQIPEHWQQHELESGHTYFTASINGAQQLELRPNCLGKLSLDIPTYIANTKHTFEQEQEGVTVSHACTIADDGKHCLVKAKFNAEGKLAEKWRWFYTPATGGMGINIDALFYSQNPEQRATVMSTVQATRASGNTPPWCTTPADWI